MNDTAFVYALLDDGKPRYVGVTTNLRRRMANHWHIRAYKSKAHLPVCVWLRSLDKRPDYRVIAQVPYAERFKFEADYTQRLRDNGFDLLNVNAGNLPPSEIRERISSLLAGRKKSPETRASMKTAQHAVREREEAQGIKRSGSAETRARMSASQRARRASEKAAV